MAGPDKIAQLRGAAMFAALHDDARRLVDTDRLLTSDH
jgi:hypothetical protein